MCCCVALCTYVSLVAFYLLASPAAGENHKDVTVRWAWKDDAGDRNSLGTEPSTDILPVTSSNATTGKSSVHSVIKLPLNSARIAALVLGVALFLALSSDYFARRQRETQALRLIKDNIDCIYNALSPAYTIKKTLSSSDLWCIVQKEGTTLLDANDNVAERIHKSELPLGSVPLNTLVYLVKTYLGKRGHLSLKVKTDMKGFFGLHTRGDRVEGLEEALTYHLGVVKTIMPMHFDRPLRSEEFDVLIKELLPLVNEVSSPRRDDLPQLHIRIGAAVRRFVTTELPKKPQTFKFEMGGVDTWDIYDAELALEEFLDDFQETRLDLHLKTIPESIFRAMIWEFFINVNAQALYEKERGIDGSYHMGDERFIAFKIIERNIIEKGIACFKPVTPLDFYQTHTAYEKMGTAEMEGFSDIVNEPESLAD